MYCAYASMSSALTALRSSSLASLILSSPAIARCPRHDGYGDARQATRFVAGAKYDDRGDLRCGRPSRWIGLGHRGSVLRVADRAGEVAARGNAVALGFVRA